MPPRKERLAKIEKELADLKAEADAHEGQVAGRKSGPCSDCARFANRSSRSKIEIEKAERAVRPEQGCGAEVRQAGRNSRTN